MTPQEFSFQWENLREQDPDYVVDVLGLTTEDLLDAFADNADAYIEKEFS